MGKLEKIILLLIGGRSDNNIAFQELVLVLKNLGFEYRIKGSHHIFYKEGVEEIINIQPNGDKAKPYQVKQVRNILVKYKMIEL